MRDHSFRLSENISENMRIGSTNPKTGFCVQLSKPFTNTNTGCYREPGDNYDVNLYALCD